MANVNEVSFFGGITKLIQAPFKLLGNAGAGVVSLASGDTDGFKNGVAGMGNSIFDAVEAPLNVAVDVLEVPKTILGGTSDKTTPSVKKIAFGTGNVMDVPIGVVELGTDVVNSLRPERKGFFDKSATEKKEPENKKETQQPATTGTVVTAKAEVKQTTTVTNGVTTQGESTVSPADKKEPNDKITDKKEEAPTVVVVVAPVVQVPENTGKVEEPKQVENMPKAPETPAQTGNEPKAKDENNNKKDDSVIVPLPLPVDTTEPKNDGKKDDNVVPLPVDTTEPKDDSKKDDDKDENVIVPLPIPVDTTKPDTTTPVAPTNPPVTPVSPAPVPPTDGNPPAGNGTSEPKAPVSPLPDTPKETDKYKTARRIVLGVLAGAALFLIFKNRGAIIKGIKGIFSKAPATGIQTNSGITNVVKGVPEQKLLTYTPPVGIKPTPTTPPVKPTTTSAVEPFVTTKHVPLEQRVTPLSEAEREALKKKLTRKIAVQEDKMWTKHKLQQSLGNEKAKLNEKLAENAAQKTKQAKIDKQMEEMFAQRKAQLKAEKTQEVKAAWSQHTHEANLEKGKVNAAKKKEIQDFLSTPKAEAAPKPTVKPNAKAGAPQPAEIQTQTPANPKLDAQKSREIDSALKEQAKEIAEKQAKAEAEAAKKLEKDMAKKAKIAAKKAEARKAKEIEDAWKQHSKEAADAKAQIEAQKAKEIEEYLSTKEPAAKPVTTQATSKTEVDKQMEEMFAQRKAQIEARKAKEVEDAWAQQAKIKPVETPVDKVVPKAQPKPQPQPQVSQTEQQTAKVVISDTTKITPEQLTVGKKVRIRMNRNTSDKVVSAYKSAFCSILGGKENAIRKHQFLNEIEITQSNLGQIKKLYKYLDILAA